MVHLTILFSDCGLPRGTIKYNLPLARYAANKYLDLIKIVMWFRLCHISQRAGLY